MNQVVDPATPRTRTTGAAVVQSGVGRSTAGNPLQMTRDLCEAPEATVLEATAPGATEPVSPAVIALPEMEPRSFRAR